MLFRSRLPVALESESGLRQQLQRLLARDPSQRFGSAAEALAAVQSLPMPESTGPVPRADRTVVLVPQATASAAADAPLMAEREVSPIANPVAAAPLRTVADEGAPPAAVAATAAAMQPAVATQPAASTQPEPVLQPEGPALAEPAAATVAPAAEPALRVPVP